MIWRQQNNECEASTQLNFVQLFGTGLFEAVGIYLVPSRPEPYVLTESERGISWLSVGMRVTLFWPKIDSGRSIGQHAPKSPRIM